MREDDTDWPSKADAAAQLGIAETEIDRLVSEKRLNVRIRRFRGHEMTLIDPESIENVQRDPGATGILMRIEEPLHLSTGRANIGAMEPALRTFLQALMASASSNQRVPVERRIFLTVAESTELSGLPARFLRRLMRDGTLKSFRTGTGWRIPRAELESLATRLTNLSALQRQELSEAETRDLEMNRLRRQGLLPPLDKAPEIN